MELQKVCRDQIEMGNDYISLLAKSHLITTRQSRLMDIGLELVEIFHVIVGNDPCLWFAGLRHFKGEFS